MKLIIIRHGQTDANAQHLVQGASLDFPLNLAGRRQAEAAAERLLPFALPVIYCSTMLRARQTAEVIGGRLGCPVVETPGLEEVHFGEAEGMLSAEARRRYKDVFDRIDCQCEPDWRQVHVPGGESINQSTARALRALENIARTSAFPLAGVVTHGSLMFNLYYHFFGQSRRFDNCEFFETEL